MKALITGAGGMLAQAAAALLGAGPSVLRAGERNDDAVVADAVNRYLGGA